MASQIVKRVLRSSVNETFTTVTGPNSAARVFSPLDRSYSSSNLIRVNEIFTTATAPNSSARVFSPLDRRYFSSFNLTSATPFPSYGIRPDITESVKQTEVSGDFNGSLHMSSDSGKDLAAAALQGPDSRILSADEVVKALSEEKAPSGGVLRPLSPHLTIYKPQRTSTFSILERIAWISTATGVAGICLLCSKASFIYFV